MRFTETSQDQAVTFPKPLSLRNRINIAKVTGEQVQHVIKKVSHLQECLRIGLGKSPVYDLQSHSAESKGKPQGKHIAQHSSLIAHLHRLQLFSVNNQCCFVEFGSGVGRFSDQLQEETHASHLHLMIDRTEFKKTRLRDRVMQKRYQEELKKKSLLKSNSSDCLIGDDCNLGRAQIGVDRLTIDIKDLDLHEALLKSFGEAGLRVQLI